MLIKVLSFNSKIIKSINTRQDIKIKVGISKIKEYDFEIKVHTAYHEYPQTGFLFIVKRNITVQIPTIAILVSLSQ